MNSDRARRRACAVALVVILALALWVRWVRAPFGLPYLHHWDEPQIASTALQMMKSGDFNPHYFHYGSLPIYVHLGVDVAHFFTLMRQDPIPFGLELAELNHDRVRLDDLQTRYDTGFHWEVSHPSFYLWNRRATAIFGALTVLLTFLLGRRLLGRHLLETSAALIAAAVLATQSFHVEHSAYVTTDVPMTFFAMASIYLAVRFAEDGRVGRLVGSLALGGLAVATKYSAALVLAAPIAALLAVCLATRKTGEASALETGAWHLFWLVPVVPVAAFFLAMPYALLDLPAFLAGAGYEIYHYSALGHGAVGVEPGWPHAWRILERIGGHFGVVLSALAIVGLASLRRPRVWLALLAPLLHLVAVAGTLVSFQRNLLPLYPFVALLVGAGWMEVFVVTRRSLAGNVRWRRLALALLVVVPATAWGWRGAETVGQSLALGRTPETRSLAVDLLNELPPTTRLGIAAELRVHRLDLDRLRVPFVIAPHDELVCAPQDYDVLLTAARYEGLWPTHPELKRRAWRLNAMQPRGVTPREIPGGDPVRLDGLSENPLLWIYEIGGREQARPDACDGSFDG